MSMALRSILCQQMLQLIIIDQLHHRQAFNVFKYSMSGSFSKYNGFCLDNQKQQISREVCHGRRGTGTSGYRHTSINILTIHSHHQFGLGHSHRTCTPKTRKPVHSKGIPWLTQTGGLLNTRPRPQLTVAYTWRMQTNTGVLLIGRQFSPSYISITSWSTHFLISITHTTHTPRRNCLSV